MKKVKKALVLSLIASAFVATPAFAAHQHYIETPGTTVCDIANGQTSKEGDAPGGHVFHDKVHIGQPGDFAFTQVDQVSVGKGSCEQVE